MQKSIRSKNKLVKLTLAVSTWNYYRISCIEESVYCVQHYHSGRLHSSWYENTTCAAKIMEGKFKNWWIFKCLYLHENKISNKISFSEMVISIANILIQPLATSQIIYQYCCTFHFFVYFHKTINKYIYSILIIVSVTKHNIYHIISYLVEFLNFNLP